MAGELIGVAKASPSTSLGTGPDRSPLEAEQQRDLGARQRVARGARAQRDELGMVNLYLRLEPHVGTPIVNRAEAEAARLYRRAKREGDQEPFERHLADAYASMLKGSR